MRRNSNYGQPRGRFEGRVNRGMVADIGPIAITVLGLVLASLPCEVRAQEKPLCAYQVDGCMPMHVVRPQLGSRIGALGASEVYLTDRAAYVVDLETQRTRRIPVEPFVQIWDSLTVAVNEFGVSERDSTVWLWDASIGPLVSISVGSVPGQTPWPRRSWYAHFAHAAAVRQETGRPIAYGGYGLYRAKDFLLEFNPKRDSWTELPNRLPETGPGPRVGSQMLTGWDPDRILLVAGRTTTHGVAPPAYTVDPLDTWSYDPRDSTWTRHELAPDLVASLHALLFEDQRVSVDPARGAIFFVTGWGPAQGSIPNSVVQWHPVSGHLYVLGSTPRELPLGFVQVGTYLTAARDSVTVMYWLPSPVKPVEEWPAFRFRFAVREDTAGAADDGPVPVGWFLGLGLMALAGFFWMVRNRQVPTQATGPRAPVSVSIARDGNAAVTAIGGTSQGGIPPMALDLLVLVADKGLNEGDLLDGDEVTELFNARYRDPDTVRVTKNRTIDQLNEVFLQHTGRVFLERVNDPMDRRRTSYRLMTGIRLTRDAADPTARA